MEAPIFDNMAISGYRAYVSQVHYTGSSMGFSFSFRFPAVKMIFSGMFYHIIGNSGQGFVRWACSKLFGINKPKQPSQFICHNEPPLSSEVVYLSKPPLSLNNERFRGQRGEHTLLGIDCASNN